MEETVVKKRGRPSKQLQTEQQTKVNTETEISAEVINETEDTTTNKEAVNTNENVTTAQQVVDCDNTTPEIQEESDGCGCLEDFINQQTTFEHNGITWTPHRYNIGDVVYVPVDQVVNNGGMFSPINAVLTKVPKRLTVASVVYTNRVSYTFKETSKIVASENFVCKTEEQCILLCKELN